MIANIHKAIIAGGVIVLTEDRRLFKATLCRPGLATIERIGATVMNALERIHEALHEEAKEKGGVKFNGWIATTFKNPSEGAYVEALYRSGGVRIKNVVFKGGKWTHEDGSEAGQPAGWRYL